MYSKAELKPANKPAGLHAADISQAKETTAAPYPDRPRLLNRHEATGPSTHSHALTLGRMTRASGSQSQQFLLRLQRQYGNHYVQRVLAIARQEPSEAGAGEVMPDVESAIERSRGGGRSLDAATRGQMESAFGADFSSVRIHTGSESHSLNRAVDALAFTTGSDIFFSNGTYNPQTSGGRELLAHELTHVVQQGAAPFLPGKAQRFRIQRMCSECQAEKEGAIQGKLTVGQPDDQYEREADQVAKAISLKTSEARQGDVFAPEGEGGDSDDQGDELTADPSRIEGDLLLQRQDGGTDGGTGGVGGATATCAHPINFALGAAQDFGPDAIQIPISWDSSTGNLADLANCTLREVVSYDAIPNPPFLWTPPNPTILTVAGTLGAAQDTHSYPPGLQTGITDPRQSGTMVAHQVYQCRCTGPGCSGTWDNIPGQTYTITRAVFPRYALTNPWRYSITKTNVAGGSREVAVPPASSTP